MTQQNANILNALKNRINPLFFSQKFNNIILERVAYLQADKFQLTVSNNGNTILISSPATELNEKNVNAQTSTLEISINKNNELSIVSNSQTYGYRNDIRYGFMQRVGYEVFTEASSSKYDSNALLMYSSSFSDEITIEDPEGNTYKNTQALLQDTKPSFENGIMVDLPNTMSQPFRNYWQRYNNTNVYKEWGRNPIHGEYSSIGVTFNDKLANINVFDESYDRLSYRGGRVCTDVDSAVKELQELFNQSYNPSTNTFDENNFYRGIEEFKNSVNADFGV